jgi:hypothetical protein
VGAKTAARLIATYGSLTAVQAAADLPPAVARRLAGAREYLAAARRVVYPVARAPVRPVTTRLGRVPAHPRRLARLAEEHQLAGPVTRVLAALQGTAATRRSS